MAWDALRKNTAAGVKKKGPPKRAFPGGSGAD